jgi:hypothetical protein
VLTLRDLTEIVKRHKPDRAVRGRVLASLGTVFAGNHPIAPIKIRSGVTNEQIIAAFISSPEYLQRNNNNARDWLFAAYQEVLSRQPDQYGLNAWLSVLGG